MGDVYTHGHHETGAAQPHLADGRELGRLPAAPPAPGHATSSTSAAARARSPSTSPAGSRRAACSASTRPPTSSPRRTRGRRRARRVRGRRRLRARRRRRARSTSSTPTRCCSTSPTRSPPSPRPPRAAPRRHPRRARQRLRRVLLVAADPRLDALARALPPAHGAQPGRGRRRPPPPGMVRAGGFSDVTVTSSNWTFADAAGREWWGGMWADRVRAVVATRPRRSSTACPTRPSWPTSRPAGAHWIDQRDGVFVVPRVEVLARR